MVLCGADNGLREYRRQMDGWRGTSGLIGRFMDRNGVGVGCTPLEYELRWNLVSKRQDCYPLSVLKQRIGGFGRGTADKEIIQRARETALEYL